LGGNPSFAALKKIKNKNKNILKNKGEKELKVKNE